MTGELKPLYVLHSGLVKSKNDGQIHSVSARRLASLYGVRWDQCVEYRCEEQVAALGENHHLVHLFPKYSGDYTLPGVVA